MEQRMTTSAEHIAEAEKLYEESQSDDVVKSQIDQQTLLMAAQVQATLAVAKKGAETDQSSPDTPTSTKNEWPEANGWPIAEAMSRIRAERPDLSATPVPHDNFVTMDYKTDRVWVWYDPATQLVTQVPKVG